MSEKKETTIVDDPNAFILDCKTLNITIQTKSTHRLPTKQELLQTFIKYDDCTIEQVGRSNQYIVRYKTSNAGCLASQKQYKSTINNVWTIDSIKYGWNTYCSSIFYPKTSILSICSKGSKCS